jgi:protein-disulfide isomerase
MSSSTLTRLATVVIAAAGLVAVAIAFAAPRSAPPARPDAAPVSFAGIPQDGTALGSASAPATPTEYADLQCPFCADYARDVLPAVVERYVRTGRLRLELRLRPAAIRLQPREITPEAFASALDDALVAH